MEGQKVTPPQLAEVAVQLPETKVAAAEVETLGGSGKEKMKRGEAVGRKGEVMQVAVRVMCLATSVTALSFMVTADQSSSLSLFGFMLPIRSRWSFSLSFRYLVGVSAAVAADSLLLVVISALRLPRKSPVIPSRNHAWLIFAVDQVLAYLTISAAAAASGVTNLNRTGVQHTALPNFCKPLNKFCDHVAVSIAFTFFTFVLLASSSLQLVLCLSGSTY